MSPSIEFYSHKIGPNPWKTVIIFEELGVSHDTTYLDFGSAKGGVENEEFLVKNAAGRVPWILDRSNGFSLTESNVINQYLVDNFDKEGVFATSNAQDSYLINKWLSFQSSSQAPFSAQAIQLRSKGNSEGAAHFCGLVKRTLRTLNQELKGKKYLVGEKCTLADLAFVPWDLALDSVLQDDPEANTSDLRKRLYPNWFAWHSKLVERPAVQRMIATQKDANKDSN